MAALSRILTCSRADGGTPLLVCSDRACPCQPPQLQVLNFYLRAGVLNLAEGIGTHSRGSVLARPPQPDLAARRAPPARAGVLDAVVGRAAPEALGLSPRGASHACQAGENPLYRFRSHEWFCATQSNGSFHYLNTLLPVAPPELSFACVRCWAARSRRIPRASRRPAP